MAIKKKTLTLKANFHALAVQQQALFSAMTEMIVLQELVFDEKQTPIDYRITDCNAAFTNIMGIPRESAIGYLASEVYDQSPAPFLDVFALTGLTGKPHQFEIYYEPLDRFFKISVVAHAPNSFATITMDITDLKLLQLQVEAKNKELEQLVYIASHDLRSPLVNVDGYSRELGYAITDLESVLEDQASLEPRLIQASADTIAEMREALRYIQTSTSQMDALLKGLLALSRSGRAALTISLVDMDRLMAKTISLFAWQIKEIGAEVCLEPLPPCRADAIQLSEVFSNLISNAIKFFSPLRPGVIKISGSVAQGRATYIVEDNGIGIAPQHQNKIFELFNRLNPSTSKGDGLGLALARQILNRLDGKIRVESGLDQGSKFFIELPGKIKLIDKQGG